MYIGEKEVKNVKDLSDDYVVVNYKPKTIVDQTGKKIKVDLKPEVYSKLLIDTIQTKQVSDATTLRKKCCEPIVATILHCLVFLCHKSH